VATVGVQGGEDPQDALSLHVIFLKRALKLVALLQKMTCNVRHPMGLRHFVTHHIIPQVNESCHIYESVTYTNRSHMNTRVTQR